MIGVLELNLQRRKSGDQLLSQPASDILLLNEQYTDKQTPFWFSYESGTAAFWIFNSGGVRILGHGVVWVNSRGE